MDMAKNLKSLGEKEGVLETVVNKMKSKFFHVAHGYLSLQPHFLPFLAQHFMPQ